MRAIVRDEEAQNERGKSEMGSTAGNGRWMVRDGGKRSEIEGDVINQIALEEAQSERGTERGRVNSQRWRRNMEHGEKWGEPQGHSKE